MKPNSESDHEIFNRDSFFEILAEHCEKQAENCMLFYGELLTESIKGALLFHLKNAGNHFEKKDKTIFDFLKKFKLDIVDEKILSIVENDFNNKLNTFIKYDDQKIGERLNRCLDNNYYHPPNMHQKILDSFVIFYISYHRIKLKITGEKSFRLEKALPTILEIDKMLPVLTRNAISHDVLKLIASEQSRTKNIGAAKRARMYKESVPFIERALDNITLEELKDKRRKELSLNSAAGAIRKYIDENKEKWPEHLPTDKINTPHIGTVKNHLKREYGITSENIQKIESRVQ